MSSGYKCGENISALEREKLQGRLNHEDCIDRIKWERCQCSRLPVERYAKRGDARWRSKGKYRSLLNMEENAGSIRLTIGSLVLSHLFVAAMLQKLANSEFANSRRLAAGGCQFVFSTFFRASLIFPLKPLIEPCNVPPN
jgi:hypothetical protein